MNPEENPNLVQETTEEIEDEIIDHNSKDYTTLDFTPKLPQKIGHLTLKSEYSFGTSFGFLARVINENSDTGFIGICDDWNTFNTYKFQQICKKHNENLTDWRDRQDENIIMNGNRSSSAEKIKPIYGIRVTVVKDASIENSKTFGRGGQHGTEYIIIAKNMIGLSEIFKLTSIGSTNFYYRYNVSASDIDNLSKNVFVIPTSNIITKRADFFGVNLNNRSRLPLFLKENSHTELPLVVVDNNFYSTMEDKPIYECYSGRKSDLRTVSQHILTDSEIEYYYTKDAIDNIKIIAGQCEYYELATANPIKSLQSETIEELITLGAKKKGIDLSKDPYKSRIIHELDIIKKKDFTDYFLVVSEIIKWAKDHMLVAVGRGSSAGSLICYCLDITDVDPIKYDLIFARFISEERDDYPDIDSDFNDKKRIQVVKHIEKLYGKDKVKTIANITTFKPKSAIGEFAKSLKIPTWEVEQTKDSILDRAGGDNRASFCISDTFNETEAGKQLIEKFPEIHLVKYIEGHAKNKSKHAAGVIVCNDPLTNFCGVDNRVDTIHLNKYDAESLNLLKIDVLGLRTLSVLEDTAKLSGFDFRDFYNINLEDEGIYDIFSQQRLSGIFQFEGATMKRLNQDAPMECFDDVAAAQALARPGALSSGGATKYVDIKNGEREEFYYSEVHKDITKNTFGIIVYQEQMMRVARELANFTWKDVGVLRKAASKSMGDEFFASFKPKFIDGCQNFGGLTLEESEKLWKDVASSGSYSFNLSHAVSYGVISNWCAWSKKYHSLQFVASILNNSKTDKDSLKILREFYDKEGLNYQSVNADDSEVMWSIQNGQLVGGLFNIVGFGVNKAKQVYKARVENKRLLEEQERLERESGEFNRLPKLITGPSMTNTLQAPRTPYDILFPADFYFYKIYNNPEEYTGENMPISYLSEVVDKKEYWCIGQMIYHDDVDLNDFVHIQKRGNTIEDNFTRKMIIRLEDDTDVLTMIISRFNYPRFRDLIMTAKLNETWFIIKGEIIFEDARIFMVKEMANLNEQFGLEEYDEQFSKMRRSNRSPSNIIYNKDSYSDEEEEDE